MTIRTSLLAFGFLLAPTMHMTAAASPIIDTMTTDGASFQCDYLEGTELLISYAADGTFSADNGQTGTWSANNDEICLDIKDGDKGCASIPATSKLGEAFQMTDIFGHPVECTVD